MPRRRGSGQGRDPRAAGEGRSRETSEGRSRVFLTFSMDTCPLYNQTTKRDPTAESHVGAVPGAQGGPEAGQEVRKVVQAMSHESVAAGAGGGEAPALFLEMITKESKTPLLLVMKGTEPRCTTLQKREKEPPHLST